MSSAEQRCPFCLRFRPLDAYPPSSRGKNGTYCRDCYLEYNEVHRDGLACRLPKRTHYVTAHRRVREARGSASDYQCSQCESQARHWAYDYSDPDEQLGYTGGVFMPFSNNPQHYDPLCALCHKRRDNAKRLEKVGAV